VGVSFHSEPGYLLFRLEGENTREEAEEAFRRAFTDPGNIPGQPLLIDARASQRHRHLSEVGALAEALGQFRRFFGTRCALVIDPGRPQPLELERRLAGYSLRSNVEFGLFSDLRAAQDWLLVPR
jgi:hypothetical protein